MSLWVETLRYRTSRNRGVMTILCDLRHFRLKGINVNFYNKTNRAYFDFPLNSENHDAYKL